MNATDNEARDGGALFKLNPLCGSVTKFDHPPGASTTVLCSELAYDARFVLYQGNGVNYIMLEEIDVIIWNPDYSNYWTPWEDG